MCKVTPQEQESVIKHQINKNNNAQQRSSIRVLGSNHLITAPECDPKGDFCEVSTNHLESKNSNINDSTLNNINPDVRTPSSEIKLEKDSKRNETKEEPPIGSPSNESLVGSLPRTLSTSVLRIKHRRSFWEKVVG